MSFYIVKFTGSTPDPKQRKALDHARIVYDGASTAEGQGFRCTEFWWKRMTQSMPLLRPKKYSDP